MQFMGLKAFLEDHLGRKVDLVTTDALKPRMRPVVEQISELETAVGALLE